MYKLTTPQQNIWNQQKYYEGTAISNICGAVCFDKKFQKNVLEAAINKFLEIQSGMRLSFQEIHGNVVQYIREYVYETFEDKTFTNMEAFEKYAKEYAKRPFQMLESKMYRIEIFHMEKTSGILVCLNHMIADAWSASLFVKNVYSFYNKLEKGEAIQREIYHYTDAVEEEKKYFDSSRYVADREWWDAEYKEKPQKSILKIAKKSKKSIVADSYCKELSKKFTKQMQVFCKKSDVSEADLFEMAIIAYLARVNSGNKHITIGIPVLNRRNVRQKRTAGMYIATIPMRMEILQDDTAEALCKRIKQKKMHIFRHCRFPYSEILETVHKRFEYIDNLYDVMVSFQNAKTETEARTHWFSNGCSEIPFTIHIDRRDNGIGYRITTDYQTDVFCESEIKMILDRIICILQQVIQKPDIFIRNLQILPKAEYCKIVKEFNNTKVDYPREKCVHELFEEQAIKYRDKIALIFEKKTFTYQQIDDMANTLAYVLREKYQIKPNDIVPILSMRNQYVIVVMLGVLRAGGAYMPIDPNYPEERIRYMLAQSKAKVALFSGYQNNFEVESISLDTFDFRQKCKKVISVNKPEDLCYVIFTSGTTGRPNGVMIQHRNLVNYCYHSKNIFHFDTPNHTFISVNSIAFDAFIDESLFPLLNGMQVVMANERESMFHMEFMQLISGCPAKNMSVTPTKFQQLFGESDEKERYDGFENIILGGEPVYQNTIRWIHDHLKCHVFNTYGPTETTVGCTAKLLESPEEPITIGKPISNTKIFIMDEQHNLLPIGVAGELCITGDGVGKGYLEAKELTEQKFISEGDLPEHSFIKEKSLYCSGDLARWSVNGEIEYLGRMDTQVKIRGIRIELEEIEKLMNEVEGISQAVAVVRKNSDERQIICMFYTGRKRDSKEIRNIIARKLPKYMLPHSFVHINEMPRMTSGKIDRKSLPEIELGDIGKRQDYVAPQSERQKVLCEILEEVLHVKTIGIEEDFFDIGADSLKVMEFVAKAHGEGIYFSVQSVFDYPTVEKLCEYIEQNDTLSVPLDKKELCEIHKVLAHNKKEEMKTVVQYPLKNILLTGATGYLGIHILKEFLESENGKAFCIVRGMNTADSYERLASCLYEYFGEKYDHMLRKRIIVLCGDLQKEFFGVEKDVYQYVSQSVNLVINCAASVKHYGTYQYFYEANVETTRRIIEFCSQSESPLVHISTLSVSGKGFNGYEKRKNLSFSESDFYTNQPLDNVYVRTKFEAEKLVLTAISEGMPANIIRMGNLTNRRRDGVFQKNYESNAFVKRMKNMLKMGILPESVKSYCIEFTPVDDAAKSVLTIVKHFNTNHTVFHINHSKPIKMDMLCKYFGEMGRPIKFVSDRKFLDAMKKNADVFYEYQQMERLLNGTKELVDVQIKNEFTEKYLSMLGFRWNDVGQEYLQKYVDYFEKIGYL